MTVASLRGETDIRLYCDTVYRELSEIKRRVFDLVCKVEATTAEEEMRKGEYFDLFDIVDYIEQKLDSLLKKCPSDWKGTRDEIEGGRKKLSDAINWWYG